MSLSNHDRPSFKKWMKRNFTKSEMKDMVKIGVNAGFHGLIYYHETTELYRQYHADIWDMLYEDAESMGYKHPLEMMATFGGAENATDRTRFENLLVWYAAERVAYALTETV